MIHLYLLYKDANSSLEIVKVNKVPGAQAEISNISSTRRQTGNKHYSLVMYGIGTSLDIDASRQLKLTSRYIPHMIEGYQQT